jgi:hypothetical protein
MDIIINFKVYNDKILCQYLSGIEHTEFIEETSENTFEFLGGDITIYLDILHNSVYIKNNHLKILNATVHWYKSYKESEYFLQYVHHLIKNSLEYDDSDYNAIFINCS